MKAIMVDDEQSAVEVFKYEARNIWELDIAGTFYNGSAALEYIGSNDIDIAFLDIEMQGMNGITLGGEIKKKLPDIMLVYMTGHDKCDKYAMSTIDLHAAGLLRKPYSEEDLRYAVESARLLSRRGKKRIFARTFGYFDLFVEGKPVLFKSAKAKELLALLVDRQGGTVTTDQIIGTLWEDRPNDVSTQSLCSKTCKTLEKELRKNGAGEILISSRGVKCLDTDKFQCDLYMLLEGKQKAAERYIGEYMMEYSWAENRTALLNKYISWD